VLADVSRACYVINVGAVLCALLCSQNSRGPLGSCVYGLCKGVFDQLETIYLQSLVCISIATQAGIVVVMYRVKSLEGEKHMSSTRHVMAVTEVLLSLFAHQDDHTRYPQRIVLYLCCKQAITEGPIDNASLIRTRLLQ
jgi:hypothetical protein